MKGLVGLVIITVHDISLTVQHMYTFYTVLLNVFFFPYTTYTILR